MYCLQTYTTLDKILFKFKIRPNWTKLTNQLLVTDWWTEGTMAASIIQVRQLWHFHSSYLYVNIFDKPSALSPLVLSPKSTHFPLFEYFYARYAYLKLSPFFTASFFLSPTSIKNLQIRLCLYSCSYIYTHTPSVKTQVP